MFVIRVATNIRVRSDTCGQHLTGFLKLRKWVQKQMMEMQRVITPRNIALIAAPVDRESEAPDCKPPTVAANVTFII